MSGVLGCQWGDEGKGKLVDILAKHFDIVARCQVLFIVSLSLYLCFLIKHFMLGCLFGLPQLIWFWAYVS